MTPASLFFWDLKAEACASWVQAWGSIIALAITGGGLVYQAHKQRELDAARFRRSAAEAYLRRAGGLSALAEAAKTTLVKLIEEVSDRQALANVVTRGAHEFVLDELAAMENWLQGVPVYDLPQEVVCEMLVLASNVRQLRRILAVAFSGQGLSTAEFASFRETLPKARASIEHSADTLAKHVALARQRAEA